MIPNQDPTKPPVLPTSDRLGARLRRHFLTGILVVTPAAVAAWVLYRLLAWVDGLLWDQIRFGWVRPGGIPGVGFVTVVLLVLLVGLLVNNYVGRRFYQIWDQLLTRIPLFNKIYIAVKQIGEALLTSNRTVFRAVGLIEYPRKGVWSLVFLTERPNDEIMETAGEPLRSVFLPTTPNPTSGFLLMVPEKDLVRLNMTVEEGLKMVISGGAYVPGQSELGPIQRTRRSVRRRRWWQRGPFGGSRKAEVVVEERPLAGEEMGQGGGVEEPGGGDGPSVRGPDRGGRRGARDDPGRGGKRGARDDPDHGGPRSSRDDPGRSRG